MQAKFGATAALVLGLAALAGGECWLLQAPLPNPFLVGLLGLALGAGLAGLIVLWWPRRG